MIVRVEIHFFVFYFFTVAFALHNDSTREKNCFDAHFIKFSSYKRANRALAFLRTAPAARYQQRSGRLEIEIHFFFDVLRNEKAINVNRLGWLFKSKSHLLYFFQISIFFLSSVQSLQYGHCKLIYLNFCLNDKREKNYVGISRSCFVIPPAHSPRSKLCCLPSPAKTLGWRASRKKVIIHYKSRTSTSHSTSLSFFRLFFLPFLRRFSFSFCVYVFFCHCRRHFVAALCSC